MPTPSAANIQRVASIRDCNVPGHHPVDGCGVAIHLMAAAVNQRDFHPVSPAQRRNYCEPSLTPMEPAPGGLRDHAGRRWQATALPAVHVVGQRPYRLYVTRTGDDVAQSNALPPSRPGIVHIPSRMPSTIGSLAACCRRAIMPL